MLLLAAEHLACYAGNTSGLKGVSSTFIGYTYENKILGTTLKTPRKSLTHRGLRMARLERLCGTSLCRTPKARPNLHYCHVPWLDHGIQPPGDFVELLSVWIPRSSRGMTVGIKKPPEGGFFMDGAPGEIRTPDRSVRSRVLYPTELQAHNLKARFYGYLG